MKIITSNSVAEKELPLQLKISFQKIIVLFEKYASQEFIQHPYHSAAKEIVLLFKKNPDPMVVLLWLCCRSGLCSSSARAANCCSSCARLASPFRSRRRPGGRTRRPVALRTSTPRTASTATWQPGTAC